MHNELGISHKPAAPVRAADTCTPWVRQAVAEERAILGGLEAAIDAVSRAYGITARRVRSYWWGQVSHVPADEMLQLATRRAERLRLLQVRARHALALGEIEIARTDALLASIRGGQDGP